MAGFTWFEIASVVRSTNTFLSHLTGASFAGGITCLTTQRILFRFSQAIVFSPFHTCLSFIISEYISFLLCSVFFPSFHPSVLPQAQWSNPPTHFLVAWPARNLLFADLPHLTDIFDFVSQDNCIFPSLFTF